MKNYPFHLITGGGKGASYSSLRQIGDLIPAGPLGQAKVRVFYNIASFNLTVADRAIVFPEFKEHVVMGYCYNSQSITASAWRLPLKSFVPPAGDGKQITMTEMDGHETVYTLSTVPSSQKMYFAPGFANGTPYLIYGSSLWYWYHPQTQVCEVYDLKGQLQERRDVWGNITRYYYSSDGLLQSITGPSQIQYIIERSVKSDGGRLERVCVKRPGQSTGSYIQSYDFDKDGLLRASCASLNGQDLTLVYQTQYDYFSINPPLMKSITQDDGTFLRVSYGTPTQNYRVQTFYLSAADGECRTDFTYSAGKVGVEVRSAWMADFFLDSQSRLVRKDQYVSYDDGPLSKETTQYEYADTGQIQKIIRPNQGVESFVYDSPYGLLTRHVRPNAQQTDYFYDNGQNRPLLQSTQVSLPDSKTAVITYTVYERRLNGSSNFADECDYLRYTISPQGRVVAYEPFPKGPVQFQRVYLSALYPYTYVNPAPSFQAMQQWAAELNPQQIMLTEYAYNTQGLETDRIRYATVDEKGNGVRDSAMSETNRYWDIYGQWTDQEKVLERDDKNGVLSSAQTNRRFDGMERITSYVDPCDNSTSTQYAVWEDKNYAGVYALTVTQPNLRVEQTILDGQGDSVWQVVTVPGKEDCPQITHWNRDLGGRPIVINNPDASTNYQSFYLDNNLGLAISTTGLVTEYLIDRIHNWECDIRYKNPVDVDQLEKLQMQGYYTKSLIKTDTADRYTYRFYDNSHRLNFEVDAKNQAIETRYDTLDREVAKILYQDPLTATQMKTLQSGQLLELNPDLSKDRCTSTYYDNDNIKIGEVDPDGWVTEYLIDNGSRIAQNIRYSTPNRASTRSSDFNAMRPAADNADAHTYYFYNARGQVVYSVDPEAFLTANVFYASEKIFQKLLYYTKISADWFKNPALPPPLPQSNSEDFLTTYQYDALERETAAVASDGVGQVTQYTNMGQICLKRRYDARKSDFNGNLDPEQTRTVQTRYDGWEHPVQYANEFLSQQMAEIEADNDLSPDQKQQQIEALWQNSTLRDTYDDVTGLKLKSTDTLNRSTVFYYDTERREVLKITPLGAPRQKFYSTFHEIVTKRQYINPIPPDNLNSLSGGFITADVLKLLIEDSAQDILEEFEYDKLSKKTRYTDPEQYIFSQVWSRFGEIIEEQQPLDKTRVLTMQHTFNNRGQEIKTVRLSDTGETLSAQQKFENCYGKVTDQIDEAGALTQQSYDRTGNLILVIDALGVTSHRSSYDALRRLLTDTDAEDQTTRLIYNQSQRTKLTQPPITGTQVEEETNVFQERLRRTDGMNETRTWKHMPLGLVVQSINELGLITQDQYDAEKQHLFHLDPIGTQTSWSYNNDGYCIQQVQQGEGFPNLTTTYSPDTFGRVIAEVNPRSVLSLQSYSQRGLQVNKIRDAGTSEQPGLMLSESWAYNGLRTKISSSQGDDKNGAQYVVSFQQDGFNRSTGKIIDPDGDQALHLTTRSKLDQVGEVSRHYDGLDRPTYVFRDALRHKRFGIDALGGIIEFQYNDLELKSQARVYATALTTAELAGITDDTTLEEIESLAATKISNQDTLNYYFYDQNRREQFKISVNQDPDLTAPQGLVVETAYNAANRKNWVRAYTQSVDVSAITTWKTADVVTLMSKHTDPDDRYQFYLTDSAGQECFSWDARGVLNESRFDELGRVTVRMKYAALVNPNIVADMNLTEMEQFVAENIADSSQDQVRCSVFNLFNKADFVVKTTLGAACSVKQYLHDEVGNQISAICYQNTVIFTDYDSLKKQLLELKPGDQDRVTYQAFDNGNRLVETTDELKFKESYQRDALDNITQRTDRAGQIWVKTYDSAKRLTSELTPEFTFLSVKPSGESLQVDSQRRSVKTLNGYDGVNNLVKKIVDADGDQTRIAITAFSIDNQEQSITVQDAEVDDPSQAAQLTLRPVIQKNLVKTTVFNAKLKKVVQIDEQNAKKFWVYDSLGRVRFEIDAMGGVTGYQRNNFKDVVVKAEYATPLNINLDSYAVGGIPLPVVLSNLKESPQDRYTFFDRNLSGDPVATVTGISKPVPGATLKDLQGVLFYYYPPAQSSGIFYAQTNRQYDSLRRPTLISRLISVTPEVWSQKYQWFDGQNNVVASAEAVQSTPDAKTSFRVKRTFYSAFNEKTQSTDYAGYFDISPGSLTLTQLDSFLSTHTSDQDRTKLYTYDLRGFKQSITRINVERDSLTLGTGNVPNFSRARMNLSEFMEYDSRGLKTLVTHEYMSGQTPPQTCTYYNEIGLPIAEIGVTFTTRDDKGGLLLITPLVYYDLNAHGQRVRKTAFLHGASSAVVDPEVFPVPSAPDSQNDAMETVLMDNRGKESAKLNPNGVLESKTYTPTGEIARAYQRLSNYGESVHVDEKRQGYDLLNRPVLTDLRRDNVSQQLTAFQHNAFGETIADGPGSSGETAGEIKERKHGPKPRAGLKSTPARCTAQWPVYRDYDGAGRLVNTNDQKSPMVHFYDLSGAETAILTSATLDLSTMTSADWPSLLQKPYSDIENTQTPRDPAGRVMAQILPAYMAGLASQPQFIPLEFLAGSLYPELGKVNLSWTASNMLNADPVFWIYPAGQESQKSELKITMDSTSTRAGVDVSAEQTGIYDVQINYFLIDPTTGKPGTTLQYFAYGRINFATANNDKAVAVIPQVNDDHVLVLTGALSNVTSIDLVDEGGDLVKRYPVQTTGAYQRSVDLDGIVSGRYQAKPVSDVGVVGLATPVFTINTSVAPTQEDALSREIPATAQLVFATPQTANLTLWESLPLDFQKTSVQLQCVYLDDNDESQTLAITVDSADAKINFDQRVSEVISLSVSLLVSKDEIVPLYVNQSPLTPRNLPPKSKKTRRTRDWFEVKESKTSLYVEDIEDFILLSQKPALKAQTINFAPQRILYLRGSAVKDWKDPPVIQFKDVSQNLQAAWRDMPSLGVTSEGLVLNVTNLAAGNYPFILPHGDQSHPYTFTIALGAQVFDAGATPPEAKLSVKAQPSQRRRQFFLDVFDNKVAIVNTLNQTTVYEFNDLNQTVLQKDPAAQAIEADGLIIPDFQGLTYSRRNVDGVEIGTTFPAGNSEGVVRNEQNRVTAIYQGDGLCYRRYVRDGFGREITIYDSRNLPSQRVYDPKGNIVQQILPNNDPQNNWGRFLTTYLDYDEKDQRARQQDPAGYVTRWLHDINSNVSVTIRPKGGRITTQWDRNRQKIYELLPNGASQRWTPDPVLGYFSVMTRYVDFGGAQFNQIYDYKLQMTSRTSAGGNRGQNAVLVGSYNSDKAITIYQLNTDSPTPGQNLRFIFDAGRLIEVDDYSQSYQTIMDYDSEDRLVMKKVSNLGVSFSTWRQCTSTLDALGRETNFFDTMLTGITQYDKNGNRRRRIAQVKQGRMVIQSDDNVYLYDAADRPTAVDCGWSGKNVVLTKPSSMFVTYQQGLRWQEITQSGVRNIAYWYDGNIAQIRDTDGSLTSHHYHPAGYRSYTQKLYTPDDKDETDTMLCDPDLFQTNQSSSNKDGADQTVLTPDAYDLIYSQSTVHYPSDGSDTVSYGLNFANVIFEENYQQSLVQGWTSDKYGEVYTQCQAYYNSNGAMQGKVGADDSDHDDDDDKSGGKLSVYFLTSHDGTVFEKIQFPTDTGKINDFGNEFDYYFYDIHNNYLSSYTVKQMPQSALGQGPKQTGGNMKLRFEGIRNSGRYGHFDLGNQYRELKVIQPVKAYAQHVHSTRDHYSQRRYVGGNVGDVKDEGEFVASITKVDEWNISGQYTVKPGDTFASIAQSQYGDAGFGPQIAEKNGYGLEASQPYVCDVLKLPPYVPMRNKSNNVATDAQLHDIIYGNLYPPLIFKQPPRHKHSCTQTLILVAISVVAMSAATVMFPPAGLAGWALAGNSLLLAVTAAGIDAGAQAVAVGLGALKHFSIQNVIETGISAGVFSGVSTALGKLEGFAQWVAQAAEAGASDLSSQLVEVACGLRKRIDIRQTLSAMATTFVDGPVNNFLPLHMLNENFFIGKLWTALTDDFADAYANVYLSSTIMGGKPDWEDALGQALGSLIGSQTGEWLKKNVKPFGLFDVEHGVTRDSAPLDYHKSQQDAKPQITYQGWEDKSGIFNLEWSDYASDFTDSTAKSTGTAQAPKATSAKPDPSVAPPNNYITTQEMVNKEVTNYLLQSFQATYPDYSSTLIWPGAPSPSNNPQLFSMLKGVWDAINPYTPLKAAWTGVDSSGTPLGIGTRLLDAAMGLSTVIPVGGLLGKVGLWGGRAAILEAEALFSAKEMIGESIETFGVKNSLSGVEAELKATIRQNILKNIAESAASRNPETNKFLIHAYIEDAFFNLDVRTGLDKAVFYSGPGNRTLAELYASNFGKTTLEMTQGGKYLDSLNLFKRYSGAEQAIKPWEILSEKYAQSASGQVTAFVNGSSSIGIFNRIELPALKINPNVTSINYLTEPQVVGITP